MRGEGFILCVQILISKNIPEKLAENKSDAAEIKVMKPVLVHICGGKLILHGGILKMRAYQKSLIDPEQVVVALIDHEPQMFFGVESATRGSVLNNVTGLAKAAKVFNVPIVLSTVEATKFSGPLVSTIQNIYPDITPIDRTTLNAWEDQNFRKAIDATGRKKILLAGLWTEVCVALPTLSAIEDGYEVFVVADASAGSSKQAHKMAIARVIQAGAKPVTWQAAMLEMQRDWANKDTYAAVNAVVKQHGGAYGLGLEYANALIPQSNS
jgi:nicotinamidase-related amidase